MSLVAETQHPWIPPSPPPCHTQTHEGLGGGVRCRLGASTAAPGRARGGRAEVRRQEGWGLWAGPGGGHGVRARARAEMPGTSGPQARAQGASRASRCPAPAAAVMTENSGQSAHRPGGARRRRVLQPPVSTARGPPGLRGPDSTARVYDLHRAWEVGAIQAQMWAWGGAPRTGAGAEAGHPQMRAEEDGGQGARRGASRGDMADPRGDLEP